MGKECGIPCRGEHHISQAGRREQQRSQRASFSMSSACRNAKSLQSCPTSCYPMGSGLPGSSVHGDSPGKNTGVGFPALLQGIFPPQG